MYVPKDKELRAEVIQLYYDVPVARHSGRWKNSRVGHKKLLVAGNNERYWEICRRM